MQGDRVVSYIRARDPSILAWSRGCLRNVRMKLEEHMESNSEENIEDSDRCIPVYLRIKGGNTGYHSNNIYQINGQTLSCKVPEGSHSFRNLKAGDQLLRSYSFTKIFNPDTTQLELFNSIVKPKVLGFLNGNNYTLFTYGTTGSGKTFTIVGTWEQPGIIPRTLEYIFRTIGHLPVKPCVLLLSNDDIETLTEDKTKYLMENKSTVLAATQFERSHQTKTYRLMQQRLSSEPAAEIEELPNVSISVWVSFGEIYNEHIYDLLKPLPKNSIRPKLRLGCQKDDMYMKDITLIPVTNGLEAYQIHQYGIHNLNYAATALNSHSSRSHSIFTIKLVQTSLINHESCVSYLRFCDLAGSERSKKTLNIGVRLKESNNINKSLLVLGRCMNIIRTNQQMKDQQLVPFRESKLTQLCQKSLMGQENIALIVNLNPSTSMFEESHHALNFSAITKDVVVVEKPIKIVKQKNRITELIERRSLQLPSAIEHVDEDRESLRDIIVKLYNEIEHQREEHEKEVMEEKMTVADMYKKYIKELKESHQEELRRKLEAEKEYYKNQIEKIKNYYKLQMLEAADNSVINISSSSDEESFSKDDLKREIEELTEANTVLEKKVQYLEERKHLLEQETKNLKEEKRIVIKEAFEEKQKIENHYKEVLAEAEQVYDDLLKNYDSLKNENKELLLNNIKLTQQNEDLNILSMCAHTPEGLSEDETNEKPLVNDLEMDEEDNICGVTSILSICRNSTLVTDHPEKISDNLG